MTDDERFIIKINIAHYQAMLKLHIDDEKRSMVGRLLAEAEEALAMDSKTPQQAKTAGGVPGDGCD